MDTVWIAHPKLEGRKVEVPASALPEHQRAGWEETEPPPPPPLPEPDPDPDPDPDQSEETTEALATAGASALPKTPRARRSTGGDS